MGVYKEIEINAEIENLHKVTEVLESIMKETGADQKTINNINIAAEEIFVNIASHAYEERNGSVRIVFETKDDPLKAVITFMDRGRPFDPLKAPDPDKGRACDEEAIGGFGIFMVKKIMDEADYEYRENMNVFRMGKLL